MKKEYIKPTTKVIILQTESLICNSPVLQEENLLIDLNEIEEQGFAD